ncbi:hypothetical protein [Rhizobium laguerreae]|uniref:hypothetical protein n=1 Tax=Rhizobium laguerreae TaxID=1076926 RepID=UPI001FEB79F5|nr:hypothetical protein [Rhizobium laguerreae]
MKNILYALSAAVVIAVVGAWIAGVRIIVIQPIGAIPDGVTIVVSGLPALNIIDSPDAI